MREVVPDGTEMYPGPDHECPKRPLHRLGTRKGWTERNVPVGDERWIEAAITGTRTDADERREGDGRPDADDRVIDLTRVQRARQQRTSSVGASVDAELMHRVGLTLNSTLELPEVLHRLAKLTLDVTDAHRCSLFLLRGHLLEPAVAIGTVRNEDLWAAFREMGPVRLDDLPEAWRRLASADAVPIEDAVASPLLPREWVQRFDLRSLVLVPLHAAGEPCGLLVVDHPTQRSYEDDEIALLESVAAYAGVAVRNARLFEDAEQQARMQRTLARGAGALVAPDRRSDLLDELVSAFAELLDTTGCAIGLFDEDMTRITTVATHDRTKSERPIPISSVPDEVVDRLTEAWTEDPGRPVVFGPDPWLARLLGREESSAHHLVIPLPGEVTPRGAVLAAFERERRLAGEERQTALALAALTSTGLDRSAMIDRLQQHSRHMEALYEASTAVVEDADSMAIVQRLNALLAPAGIEVDSLAWRDEAVTARLGGASPTDEELASWEDDATDTEVSFDGAVSVPMRLQDRVIGGLRVRSGKLDDDDRPFVRNLARGVAEVVHRGTLRASLEEAARRRAVADERDRIAADLHDVVGQLFIAIGLLARRAEEHLPNDSRWSETFRRIADLGDSGKWKIDQAVRALASVPAAGRALPSALRQRAEALRGDSGIDVLVDIQAWPSEVPADVQRTLYRVAHEALTNAWRHAHCSVVRVCLDVEEGDLVLRVKDDGVGLRSSGGLDHVGIGLHNMRRSTKDVGGSVRVRNIRPHGTEVEAKVPLAGRR